MTKIHTTRFVFLSDLTHDLPDDFAEMLKQDIAVSFGDASHTLCGLDTLIDAGSDGDFGMGEDADQSDALIELINRINAAKEAGVEFVDLEN